MKRTFIYTDAKSHKFWSIEVTGNNYTVKYGKVGSEGQTQVKEFADEAACLIAVEKIIAEKTKKGYVEEGSTDSASSTKEEKPKKAVSNSAVKESPKENKVATAKVQEPVLSAGDRDHRQFLYQDGVSSKFWNIERDVFS